MAEASTAPRQPPAFWVALGLSALFLVLIVLAAVGGAKHGGRERAPGWSAVHDAVGWRVSRVDAGGVAARRLATGDRILALNGDARIARLGPHWALRELPSDAPYRLRIARGGGERDVELVLATRPSSGWVLRLVVYLFIALTYLVVATLIGLGRPTDRTAQYAFAACFTTGLLMVWIAVGAAQGIQRDALTRLLGASFPLHGITGYLFFNVFPVPIPRRRGWSLLTAALLLVGGVTWLLQLAIIALQFAGMEWTHAWFDGPGRPMWAYFNFVRPAWNSLIVFLTGLLDCVLLWRNYHHVATLADRRRIVFAVWGLGASVLPGFLLALVSGVGQIVVPDRAIPNLETLKMLCNAALVLGPVALGYAIVRHRVLGISLVVRLGIQYLLAQNMLRVLLALPVAGLVWMLVTHRDQSVASLLFSQASGVNLALLGGVLFGLRFRPRIQASIDRRFFREAYDQEQILLRLVESVKPLDSIEAITGEVSREIDRALHPKRVLLLLRDPDDGALRPAGSPAANGGDEGETGLVIRGDSPLIGEVERAQARAILLGPHVAEGPGLRPLFASGIELVVPVRGVNQDLMGAMLLGPKRSEAPFTGRDRNLLGMIAGQVGAMVEVMQLRASAGRQRGIATEVLGRLDRQGIRLMKECPVCGRCYDAPESACTRDGAALMMTLPVERVVERRYRLEQLLGKGGMGAVYEATDLRLDRRVALKVMRNALGDPTALRRFSREAQASARIAHPNVVPVYDHGEIGRDSAFIVMHKVSGPTWRAELARRRTFPRPLAAHLLGQLCSGIEAAHAVGLLHRDLKPENVVLEPGTDGGPPTVRILDFGLAKLKPRDSSTMSAITHSGETMGTLGYMPPEQLRGEDVDERADVYAIGVIALESLGGPIERPGIDFYPAIERALAAYAAAIAGQAGGSDLTRTLRQALAPAREDRQRSVTDLRADLAAALAE